MRAIGDDVIGHQNKAHGMAIDAEDNIWICDENGDTVMKLSPEGKLLMTIGVRGSGATGTKRRDSGCSGSRCTRVRAERRHLHRRGPREREPERHRQVADQQHRRRARAASRQERHGSSTSGSATTPGRATSAWSTASPSIPTTATSILADREEYRLVVLRRARQVHQDDSDAQPAPARSYVDPHKQLWLATGQDGQIFKIDWDGNVLERSATRPGPRRGESVHRGKLSRVMDSRAGTHQWVITSLEPDY